ASLRNIERGEAFHSSGAASGTSLPKDFSSWSGVSDGDQREKVILLCGIHENNADAIMLARLSGENIALLSVPRDIYYEQRKLSSYYRVYGPEELSRVISEITGISIDGYISVDMYAFIEVVDTLGGIEVTLEEALIDPTYRVKDDGRWSTLHYPAGSHTLNGIEALRVARSRHTSDDFDRAKRQHLILAALKEKLNSLHAGDISKLREILETLFTYIHTDYSLMEAVRLFSSFHDVPVASLEGLSSENVLYVTYSNLHRLGKDMDEVEEDFPKGAWILLPEEDDWRAIEWFVQSSFGMIKETAGE
ncbi:MAG: LCP family protein, partial [Spirochaetia bacterium]